MAINPQRDRRGQALVEFALVMPILLILALLTAQYGIIFRTTMGLTNLSREGARYAATAPALDSAIRKRITDSTPAYIKPSDVTVTFSPPEGDATRARGSGGQITVTISYPMSKKLFLPATFLGVNVFSTTYTTQATFAIQ